MATKRKKTTKKTTKKKGDFTLYAYMERGHDVPSVQREIQR